MATAHILVIEDDPGTQLILEHLLQEAGFKVIIAEHGIAALETLQTIKPDLILTDLMMPKLGGIGLIQRIRRMEGLAGVPIIALTGYGDSLSAAVMAAGATLLLRKPEDMPDLVETINQLLA